jgi:hypothetical protein
MEAILLILSISGKTLFTAIIIFLMAIPSGMGLGLGLHMIKKVITWVGRKKLQDYTAKYSDIWTQAEQAAIVSA